MLLQRSLCTRSLVAMAVERQSRADRAGVRGKDASADDKRPSLVERLEHALVLVAYIVLRHGPIYAPYIDRLERELEAARQNDPTERAKRILETYAAKGDTNAARLGVSWRAEENAPVLTDDAGRHDERPRGQQALSRLT
jgi:hypothetical protein